MIYHIRLIDRSGKATSTLELISKSDERALLLLSDLVPYGAVELWEGTRLVTRLERQPKPDQQASETNKLLN